MKLQKDLREFIELLNSAKVKYILVGGHAVAHHGFPRFTGDIDLFFDWSAENVGRLSNVLKDFGFESLSLELAASAKPGMVFQLGRPPYRIDLLPAIDGVSFGEAWSTRERAVLDGLEIFILSKPLLLRNKRASGRAKDLEDLRQLGEER
jgi:hypothetical protein